MLGNLLTLIFISPALANPGIFLPINAQVPPIARVNQTFEFVFAASTFTSGSNILNYTLKNAPSWLQLDSPSRTFSGLPSTTDAGSSLFTLQAADATGITSMPVTFIVAADDGPRVGEPVAKQLSTRDDFSEPDTLLVLHSSRIFLAFSSDTFTNVTENTVYYAMSANHTPLPSWINFYPNNLTFAGMTPSATSLTELPQTYSIAVIASNVVGFAGAISTFQVTVERHLFTFINSCHTLNITAGSQISYNGLQGDLSLDDRPVNISNIAQVTTDAPSWLSLDNKTLAISGTAPQSVVKQNYTVNVTDVYGESALTSLRVAAKDDSAGLLQTSLDIIKTNGGSRFLYDLRALLNDPNAAITVSLGSAAAWLSFDPGDLELKGTAPTSGIAERYTLNITAVHSSRTQTSSLTIMVLASCSLATASGTSCPTTAASGVGPVTSQSGSRIEHDKRWIALLVILPLFTIAVLVFLAFCILRRRRRHKEGWETESSVSSKPDASAQHIWKSNTQELEYKMSGALDSHRSRSSSRFSRTPPLLDMSGLWKSFTATRPKPGPPTKANLADRYSISRRDSWNSYANHFNLRPRSSAAPGDTIVEETSSPDPRTRDRASKVRSTFPRFSVSSNASASRQVSQSRGTKSKMSFGSSALISTRTNGLGHGRNIPSYGSNSILLGTRGIGHGDGSGPPGYGTVRDSWRNFRLLKALAGADSSSSSGFPHGLYLPQPPSIAFTRSRHDRASIRVVDPPSRISSVRVSKIHLSDNDRPSTAQRMDQFKRLQEFHRKRVLLKNAERALFTAGPSSSRISSYGNVLPPAPIKHASNSKERRSPKRHRHASDVKSFVSSPLVGTKYGTCQHKKTLSEISDLSSHQLPIRGRRTPSPTKSSHSLQPGQENDRPGLQPNLSSVTLDRIRLALVNPISRKDSLMSDDYDSRWESASSDAVSMDPYVYSHDIRHGRTKSSSPSRWTGQEPQSLESKSPERRRTTNLQNLTSSRHSFDRLVQGVKRLAFNRAEHRGSSNFDDDPHSRVYDYHMRGDEREDRRYVKGKEEDGMKYQEGEDQQQDEDEDEDEDEERQGRGRQRGRRQKGGIRVIDSPARPVSRGHKIGVRKGEPGNMSLRGNIGRVRATGEDERDEGGSSAFV